MTGLDIEQYAIEVGRSETGMPDWNLPIDHWSPSSLGMFMRCPYQWQQRYIRGLKKRPAEAPMVGSAVHGAIEKNFAQKVESREDIPIIDLLDAYAEEIFPAQVVREQEQSGFEMVWDTDFERARQRGKVMLSAYHGEVSPRVQPLAAEGKVSVDLGAPVPVIGRFDVEKAMGVIDVKTGRRKYLKPRTDWLIQAAVYSEAKEKPVEFHSVSATMRKDGGTGTISVVTPLESEALLVHPTRDERAEMRRSIRTVSAMACMFMAMYGPDEDWPATGRIFHDWACDYCGFIEGCPAWKGTR